jgi:hypothetical protein
MTVAGPQAMFWAQALGLWMTMANARIAVNVTGSDILCFIVFDVSRFKRAGTVRCTMVVAGSKSTRAFSAHIV